MYTLHADACISFTLTRAPATRERERGVVVHASRRGPFLASFPADMERNLHDSTRSRAAHLAARHVGRSGACSVPAAGLASKSIRW
jgi:hypothetical protein